MKPSDLTIETLISWGGDSVFNRALKMAHSGKVVSASWNAQTHEVSGKIATPTGWDMPVKFDLLDNGTIKSKCPCRDNQEYGQVCPHVVAIGLLLMDRANNPEAKAREQAEIRAAQRMAQINPDAYIKRSPNGIPVRVSLRWTKNAKQEFYSGGVKAKLFFIDAAKNRYLPDDPRLKNGIKLSPANENLLCVLEDICAGPASHEITLEPLDFINILELMTSAEPVEVELHAEYFEENGHFALFPFAKLPFAHIASSDKFFVHGNKGFVCAENIDESPSRGEKYYPIKKVLPGPFQIVYKEDQIITREAMPAFIYNNLPLLQREVEVKLSPSEDMFKFIPDKPVILIRLSGTRASLSAQAYARYGEKEIVCYASLPPDAICRPDPEDFLLYHVRNKEAEAKALYMLEHFGFKENTDVPLIVQKATKQEDAPRMFITDPREVLNFLGSGIPSLRRMGWKFEMSPRLEPIVDSLPLATPIVNITDAPRESFDVGYSFNAEGCNIPETEIQKAINRGESFVTVGDKTVLIDTEAVKAIRDVFSDCASQGNARAGRFRVGSIYAPYVRESLNALSDAVDVEAEAAPTWREISEARSRDENAKYEPVDLGAREGILRPYQKQGVYWMRFLEKSGLSGLLADEMGLGKTLQTLTWISLQRTDPAAQGKPALVVCPTSLVANWNAEAEKFVPELKRLVISGPDRANNFNKVEDADLVITSYALLQRDIEDAYLGKKFSVIVLDEAQHIKNRRTKNAVAAKQLDSVQKLVLTGTPVENSVADVWSIFDFLLPDYLGAYDLFRASIEIPISEGGQHGAAAQEKLHHKLSPFILRRLKKDVAKDLPDKIIKVAYCPMTDEQQRWYNDILSKTRTKIKDMVKEKGFQKSRIEILALLMRLRQISNHVGLLKEYREKHGADKSFSDNLSGKLDAFFELLDEAIDGGHRVLVFSQFVQMLSILRDELEKRGIKYCYLDGATKDRLGACKKFNTDESIPLFLISLHAGGTGLNLTGADMVVHFDPWWNPAVEAQATDRAHRIGQKRTVYVVKMISEHSVEERVLALQQKKQLVIDATVGTTDAEAVQKLTYDDIKSIVGL